MKKFLSSSLVIAMTLSLLLSGVLKGTSLAMQKVKLKPW